MNHTGPPAGEALPFTNIEELAALNTVNFGCIGHGSTSSFFAQSDNPTYKRIFERMTENSSFVQNSVEGINSNKNNFSLLF